MRPVEVRGVCLHIKTKQAASIASLGKPNTFLVPASWSCTECLTFGMPAWTIAFWRQQTEMAHTSPTAKVKCSSLSCTRCYWNPESWTLKSLESSVNSSCRECWRFTQPLIGFLLDGLRRLTRKSNANLGSKATSQVICYLAWAHISLLNRFLTLFSCLQCSITRTHLVCWFQILVFGNHCKTHLHHAKQHSSSKYL